MSKKANYAANTNVTTYFGHIGISVNNNDKTEVFKLEVGKKGVAPLRVALVSWPDEIEKWDEFSDFSYSVINGSPNTRLKAASEEADLHIINRENLRALAVAIARIKE